jgi:hypothetical protein
LPIFVNKIDLTKTWEFENDPFFIAYD